MHKKICHYGRFFMKNTGLAVLNRPYGGVRCNIGDEGIKWSGFFGKTTARIGSEVEMGGHSPRINEVKIFYLERRMKNVFNKLLAVVLATIMLMSMVPKYTAQAAGNDLTVAVLPAQIQAADDLGIESTAPTSTFDLTTGVGSGLESDYHWAGNWLLGGGVLTIRDGAYIEITGGEAFYCAIEVEAYANVHIILNGVLLRAVNDSPLKLNNGACVMLNLIGENTVEVILFSEGMSCAGVRVPVDTFLTITEESTGNLTATGGYDRDNDAGGAGIGGDGGYSCGTITINGGTVTAKGGRAGGAGIGGGSGYYRYGGVIVSDAKGGTVTINGGTIIATGTNGGAGIGGGVYSSGGTVIINGGTVTATSEVGAGIGSGYTSTYPIDRSHGTFDMNGNAVVFASSVGDIDISRRTNGLLFIENSDVQTGVLYGFVELADNINVRSNGTLTILEKSFLVIPESFALINDGLVRNNGSILNIGSFENYGIVENNGEFINYGDFIPNNSTIYGKEINFIHLPINGVPIFTADQLNNIRNGLNRSYTIMRDIPLSEFNGGVWEPIGTESKPFTGTINGGFNMITGVNVAPGSEFYGLIGYNAGTIKNLGVEYNSRFAGIAGINNDSIQSCLTEFKPRNAKQWTGSDVIENMAVVLIDLSNRSNRINQTITIRP
ncbi:MAG: hypothetical protein FWD23_13155, partial [Oscillospiraceae bacterium]|nr:hypothetical protein [Oscillospiraceae bacterium]